jgi:hypothetical protein
MLVAVTSIFSLTTRILLSVIKEPNMQNAKKINLFLVVFIASFTMTHSCTSGEKLGGTGFEFVQADKYFVPPADEITAILIRSRLSGKKDFNSPLALIGDKEMAEKITGRSLEPEKLFEDRGLLKKIADAYRDTLKEAEENNFERDSVAPDGAIYFITPKKGYMRIIGIDEDVVYDSYMESEPLKKYFDELGLTKELSPSGFSLVGASNYRLPSTDKVVAILLYPQYPGYYADYYPPAAILGDKKKAEKLFYENKELAERHKGKLLEPKKLIEGREWLVKIMDAYRAALGKAKEKALSHERYKGTRGRIIFVTEKYGYSEAIGVDANTVYDKYMESELLKKYFDELGITNEMGRSEFNISFMGNNDVPLIADTTAILLYPPYDYNLYTPLVLIGDKKLTEEMMGISLEPGRIIEGRDWLVKIMDAYMAKLKEVEESKAYLDLPIGDWRWQIVFVTAKKGYQDPVYDLYMESGLLKQYFDELGLTKELLSGEPNKVTQN